MKKTYALLALAAFSVGALAGCAKKPALTIWVGSESKEFYAEVMADYIADYKVKTGEDFPHKIEVQGVDSSAAAANFLQDTDAGADIFTIPHDNLGKLTSGASVIAPFTDQTLIDGIYENSSEMFHDVIKATVGGTEYTFAAPVIAQSLVLFYNKNYVTPEQAESWEGLMEAAQAVSTTKGKTISALMPTGEDGYNNSFLLLGVNEQTKESSLRLYENGDINDQYAHGDDSVARFKWGQRFFNNQYGAVRPSSSGWQVALKDELTLSTISGAWSSNAAKQALGSGYGIAKLPKFTITAADAVGDVAAGTVMRSGTFVDAKMLVMKKNSKFAEHLQPIVKHLFSKEIQEASFEEVDNLPTYKNASTEFAAMATNDLAVRQVEMYDYGRPQPFGVHANFNFYYYSKGAPDRVMQILLNLDNAYGTTQKIVDELLIIENIWKTGEATGGAA